MKWMLLPVALTAGLLVAADAKDDAVKKDMDALQGKWHTVSFEINGKQFGDLNKDDMHVIEGDKYSVSPQPGVTFESGTFKIDPTAKPKTMDFKPGGGTMLGIYEIDGDTLKICWARSKNRPTDFSSKEGKVGSDCYLAVYKKIKE